MADRASLAILGDPNGWHVGDLLRAAATLNIPVCCHDFRTLQTGMLDDYGTIIVRTMPRGSLEQVIFRMDLLHEAEVRGQRVVNPPRALEICVDKFLCDVRLRHAGLPLPESIVCQTAQQALAAWERLGGDVIVKPLFGSEGRGLVRLTDPDTAQRVFHALEAVDAVLYLQQFLKHPGWDVRALVGKGRLLGSMKRHQTGDWRTNIARGGRAERHTLSAEEHDLAIAAAEATGTALAGVDLLYANERWYVLEVNAVPGWKALAAVTGVDVAQHLLADLTFGPSAGR